MISLIKNEFLKIFKKRSTWIMGIVILVFITGYNVINKIAIDMNSNSSGHFSEANASWYEKLAEGLDPSKTSDVSTYIDFKTEADVIRFALNYDTGSWQQALAQEKMQPLQYALNEARYSLKDETKVSEIQEQITTLKVRFDSNDWKNFTNEDIADYKIQIEDLEKELAGTVDNKQKEELDSQIKGLKVNLEMSELRLAKNIDYSYENYLNNAIYDYIGAKQEVISSSGVLNPTYNQKYENQFPLRMAALAKYTLDNEVEINNSVSARERLMGSPENYIFLVLICIIMMSGTIVSDEFNKGTIKLLLIKPYARTKILLAKFITIMLMIPIIYGVIMLLQTLVGGITFGFDSYSIPAVVYNFSTNAVETMSIIKYLILGIIQTCPQVILLATLSFALGTIVTNVPLAIALPLAGGVGASIINIIAIEFGLKFMRYFVTLNWDLSQFAGGAIPQFEFVTLEFSVIMCLIYFIVMLIPTFIIFKRKNIKNI